jgi:hypothetical protein
MAIELLRLLALFENVSDRESDIAYFRTHVPWIGSLAYLHIIFKPAPEDVLADAARRLRMPVPLIEFLARQNGAILFSGALSVDGVHRTGQLLNREDPFSLPPYNIENENNNWPPYDPERFLGIGGYSFDGSTVCIDRRDQQIYLFERGQETLLQTPLCSWQDLDQWITSEITRLSVLFDRRGKALVKEFQTLPPREAPS